MYRVVIYVTIKTLMTQNETMNNIVEVVGLVVHTINTNNNTLLAMHLQWKEVGYFSLCSLRYRIQLEC